MTRRSVSAARPAVRKVLLVGLVAAVVACVGLTGRPTAAQTIGEKPIAEQSLDQLLFNARHHIVTTASYQLATRYIRAVLARKPEAKELVDAIRNDPILNPPEGHSGGLDEVLARVIASTPTTPEAEQLRDACKDLQACIEQSRDEVIRKWEEIMLHIGRLNRGVREFDSAAAQLRKMAPWSASIMVEVLTKADYAKLRVGVIRALPKMGQHAVGPLCVALDMAGDVPTKIIIVNALREIGYPQAAPYIQRLAEQTASDQLRPICTEAVETLLRSPRAEYSGSAAQMFARLGDEYYSDAASLRPRTFRQKETGVRVASVWFWDPSMGVRSVDVPREIYNEVMAMRSLERALALDGNQPMAVSLWVAANIRREAQLPADPADASRKLADPSYPAGRPGAHYYAVACGSSVLLRALGRACEDGDSAVAFGLAKALADVGFASSVGDEVSAVALALRFPDRKVRYEVALAMASARSTSTLPDAGLVVPTLASAVGQTGEKYTVALLAGAEKQKLLDQIRQAGYHADAVDSLDKVLEWGRSLAVPHVDLVVLDWEAEQGGLSGLARLRKDYRFRNAAVLMVATAIESARVACKDFPSVRVIEATTLTAQINEKAAEIAQARGDTGLTQEEAADYALRAAMALRDVALSPTAGFDFSVAIPTLIRALRDPRLELVSAVAEALSYADSLDAQRAMAQAALDAQAEPERRIIACKSLAASAKRFGNRLISDQVDRLLKAVMAEPNLEVRDALAQAVGGLNLPVKLDTLILSQSKLKPAAGGNP